jgi:hypothetical protein
MKLRYYCNKLLAPCVLLHLLYRPTNALNIHIEMQAIKHMLWQLLNLYMFRKRNQRSNSPKRLFLRTALFWVITQRVVIISYRGFGEKTFGPIFGVQESSWTLKIGPIGCLETWVRNCYYSLRNDPEEGSSYLHRGGNLNSRSFFLACLTLEDGVVCSETSEANYYSTLRKIPE